MSQAKHTCNVAGMKFEFMHISPRPLRKIFLKLAGKLVSVMNPDTDFANIDIDDKNGLAKLFNLKYIIENFDSLLTEEEIQEVENVLFSQCYCYKPVDGSPGQVKMVKVLEMYEHIFKDDFFATFELLKEAFKCYYSNFLAKAGMLTNLGM